MISLFTLKTPCMIPRFFHCVVLESVDKAVQSLTWWVSDVVFVCVHLCAPNCARLQGVDACPYYDIKGELPLHTHRHTKGKMD